MGAAFPRVLIITDVDLSATSRGAGRTLLNLLSQWPAERARIISTNPDALAETSYGHRVIDAASSISGEMQGYLRRLLGDAQAQTMSIAPLDESAVEDFAAEVSLVVPTQTGSLVLGKRWAAHLRQPSATWLMDDWIQQYPSRWLSGSADKTARKLLEMNSGWLVISEYLGEELKRWTGLERPTHVVHNAVTIGSPPAALTTPRSGRFRLRYAGTIWPMHADALTLLARAVATRRAAGDDIELVLHTDDYGWRQYEKVWKETGTVFGKLVPYESLRDVLADSDLLVVASSFAAEHARMTQSSVQTKITDYLASGRAILSVGPADGACARFLRARDIALYMDANDVSRAAEVLRGAITSRASLGAIAARGWEVCKRDHEIGAVGRATAAFLASLVVPRKS